MLTCRRQAISGCWLELRLESLAIGRRAGLRRGDHVSSADGVDFYHQPCHIFSVMLAGVFFGVDGRDGFTPRGGAVWDPREKRMEVWGSGDEEWNFTTEEDAG
jgi:hypothetical protein